MKIQYAVSFLITVSLITGLVLMWQRTKLTYGERIVVLTKLENGGLRAEGNTDIRVNPLQLMSIESMMKPGQKIRWSQTYNKWGNALADDFQDWK